MKRTNAVTLGARTTTAIVTALLAVAGAAAAPDTAPLQALPELEVAPYLGTWYQAAFYPNFFQRDCISDTTATYGALPDGSVSVTNRCRDANGAWLQVQGLARPDGSVLQAGVLKPAQLEVSFLPVWLRWTGIGWGRYWVVNLPPHRRYAIVSEPKREYLWLLSRTPQLSPADDAAARATLRELGFDLDRLQPHRHTGAPPPAP